MEEEVNDYYDYNLQRLKTHRRSVNLPIAKYKLSILYELEQSQVLILVSPTGTGKSTQLPQYLYNNGWCKDGRKVAITQPRRVACTTVASWVAQELDVNLGEEVGYTVRFDDKTSPVTAIQFFTDGMLVRNLLRDPLLSDYSIVIVDEAHERTVSTDILIALLKRIQRRRPDLRIIIMSATVDVKTFYDYFTKENSLSDSKSKQQVKVATLNLTGKGYPLDIHYLEQPCTDYLEESFNTVKMIHQQEPDGDILVFVTGKEEVDDLSSRILTWSSKLPKNKQLIPMPLHANLSLENQHLIFEKLTVGRKVVVSTNLAETSVTIPNVRYVIDCGFVKLRSYDLNTGFENLQIQPISQASAIQRAGRAGREAPGKVYRLYTEPTFHHMQLSLRPELQRSDLKPTLLNLLALGVDKVARFDFLEPPPAPLVQDALEYLNAIDMIDLQGKLSPELGIQLAEFPLHPTLSKMLVQSIAFGCTREILTVVAMAQCKNIFNKPDGGAEYAEYEASVKKFAVEEGDSITFINIYNAFNKTPTKGWCQRRFINFNQLKSAQNTRNQLFNQLQRLRPGINLDISCNGDVTKVQKTILTAYPFQTATLDLEDGALIPTRAKEKLYIHPDSVLFHRTFKMVTYMEVLVTKRPFASILTTIDPEWLPQLFPNHYQLQTKGRSQSAYSMGL